MVAFPTRDARNLRHKTIRLPADDWRWLDDKAVETNSTRSEELRKAVAVYRIMEICPLITCEQQHRARKAAKH